ncbi:MAG: flagellar protein FlbB [Treponema sp.]|nr:flagellar protein FlbB [Treponema sp.]
MARGNGLGKSIVLIILIIILVAGGLLWFDYLGVIHAKKVFAPIYRLVGLKPQTSVTATSSKPLVADLDDDRLAKRLEALDIRTQELDKREGDIAKGERQYDAVMQELEDRRKSLEEREATFEAERRKYDDRDKQIAQVASYLAAMPPKTAVEEILNMQDQDIIDIFRKEDEKAAANRTASMVSVWLMNMPADRAATIQRKMTNKPQTLD